MRPNKWMIAILSVIVLLIVGAALDRDSQWEGIDVSVVGKYATELGVEPGTPLINLQGDALLFAFAAGGAIGGFIAGYYWRELFGAGDKTADKPGDKTDRRVGNPSIKRQAGDVRRA